MRKKRFLVFLLTIVLMVTVLPLPVSANSPEPSPWYEFQLSNLPKGTVYVDLLIYLPEADPMYTVMNDSNIPDDFSENAQILSFVQDNYQSYTFHYKDALSVIRVDRFSEVYFFTDVDYELVRYDHADEIYQRGEIRLAMLDRQGNILKISPLLDLSTDDVLSYITGTFRYDGETDDFEVLTGSAGFGLIFLGFLCFVGLMLTCFAERVVAILFNLHKRYGLLIILTNIASQLLMHIGYILFYNLVFSKYTYATFILEVLIYLGEYLVYRWVMKDISERKKIAYVAVANTASLTLGLLTYRKLIF